MSRKIDDIIKDIQSNENSINKIKDAKTINELQNNLKSERIALLDEYYKTTTQTKIKPKTGIDYYIMSFVTILIMLYIILVSLIYGIFTIIESNTILIPIIKTVIILGVITTAFFSIIAIILKYKDKHKHIIICLSLYILFFIYTGIECIISETTTVSLVILESVMYLFVCILISTYYSRKKTNIQIKFLKIHVPLTINILVTVLFFGTATCVYLYSIVNMFEISTLYGLFGVFVPGIAQFVYLHEIGYDSYYAGMCYLLALSYAETFVLQALFSEE